MSSQEAPRPAHGFTIIELLVVIAIIGILAAVVLAFLGDARKKGVDSAIKKAMAEINNQAELFYQSNNFSYVITPGSASDVCSPSGQAGAHRGIYNIVKSAADASGVALNTSRTTASSVSNPAVCHACTNNDASCNASSDGNWGALVQIKSDPNSAFCVDSTGFRGVTAVTALASGDATCQ